MIRHSPPVILHMYSVKKAVEFGMREKKIKKGLKKAIAFHAEKDTKRNGM